MNRRIRVTVVVRYLALTIVSLGCSSKYAAEGNSTSSATGSQTGTTGVTDTSMVPPLTDGGGSGGDTEQPGAGGSPAGTMTSAVDANATVTGGAGATEVGASDPMDGSSVTTGSSSSGMTSAGGAFGAASTTGTPGAGGATFGAASTTTGTSGAGGAGGATFGALSTTTGTTGTSGAGGASLGGASFGGVSTTGTAGAGGMATTGGFGSLGAGGTG